ncbi:MAG: hypothetical protein Kow00105_19560 [Phycisphaeraceae bacterium]
MTMLTSHDTDVATAESHHLSRLGRSHATRPLNRQLRQLIDQMDDQTLVSLTAYAMERLEHGPRPTRRLPI